MMLSFFRLTFFSCEQEKNQKKTFCAKLRFANRGLFDSWRYAQRGFLYQFPGFAADKRPERPLSSKKRPEQLLLRANTDPRYHLTSPRFPGDAHCLLTGASAAPYYTNQGRGSGATSAPASQDLTPTGPSLRICGLRTTPLHGLFIRI